MTSLLEQLPKIVADGKREAERIMERLDSNYRVGLQTRELVQGIVCYVLGVVVGTQHTTRTPFTDTVRV